MDISKAIIICIGDELLMGQTLDTNSFWLGPALGKFNIQVIQKLCIIDLKTVITKKFQFHWDRSTNKELAAKSALFFLLKNYKNL